MTREEAIAVLQKIKPIPRRADGKSTTHLLETIALDMAIQSLSQEPCDDAISREYALNSLIENTDFEGWELSQALEAIEKLPPVTQKSGKWISVSERLPEDKTYVLTTIKVPNRIAHARSGWYEGGFFHNDNGDTWNSTDREVVAWMPLPNPCGAKMFEPQESEE